MGRKLCCGVIRLDSLALLVIVGITSATFFASSVFSQEAEPRGRNNETLSGTIKPTEPPRVPKESTDPQETKREGTLTTGNKVTVKSHLENADEIAILVRGQTTAAKTKGTSTGKKS